MASFRQNFENEISRLEVIAILANVLNVVPQAPLMFKKEIYDSKNFHLRGKSLGSQFVTMVSKADRRG